VAFHVKDQGFFSQYFSISLNAETNSMEDVQVTSRYSRLYLESREVLRVHVRLGHFFGGPALGAMGRIAHLIAMSCSP